LRQSRIAPQEDPQRNASYFVSTGARLDRNELPPRIPAWLGNEVSQHRIGFTGIDTVGVVCGFINPGERQHGGQSDLFGGSTVVVDKQRNAQAMARGPAPTEGERTISKTFDTVRLDIQADDIPYAVGVLAASTRIDYCPVRIGAVDVLLPQSAEMTMLLFNDWEERNNIAFTHCKEYGVDSAISFDPPAAAPSVAPAPPKEIEIPAGLVLATRIETAFDSNIAARGDRVRARVETDVKYRSAVLVPQGTIVTGRIRTFDRYGSAHYFLVALEFYRFELPRGPVRFFAEMQKISPLPGGVHPAVVSKLELPGVATFSIEGDSVLLAPGTRMVWKTSRYGPSPEPKK
jgi:hypothetical protein